MFLFESSEKLSDRVVVTLGESLGVGECCEDLW